ncbi:TonB-dependent receptor plug domain-containing protein [Paraglaciecola arctica]|uniref:TonB-dependent receptor plug domain-containing protein n=1 Tax=Paraglaciecola arctica TaxID=1128911 RepID=UPI001C06C9FE|nr:TonB-dependent receptor [Paraglaciecola arctica]MBU3006140.1 TonB-dependent receptor [Paraglaciecola arctica]
MKITTLLTSKKLLALSISAALTLPVIAQETQNAAEEVEKVQVTGSYIKRTAADEAEPVQVLDFNYIQSTGATTVAELIGKLAISSGAENQADSFSQASTQGTGNVNLRGLGLSSTLVLINGRRQTLSGAITNDGSVFVDSSHIPIEAIEQVEVLKEGAASTYGSDAIAGVVNFILRKDFEGFEVSAGIGKAADSSQKDTDFGFLWGAELGNTFVTVSGHYLDRTPLTIADRPELGDVALSSLGNTFLLLDNAEVADGPYAGSYGAYQSVPDPTCLDNDLGVLIPQAYGSRCGFNFGPLYNLVNTETRLQLYSNVNHYFDNGNELTVDMSWSSNEVKDNPQSPSYPDLTFPYIGPTDSGNPFGVGVVWLGRPLGAGFEPALAPRENDTFRTSVNLVGDLDNGWSWDTALTYSKNTYTQYQQDQLKSRLVAALAGEGGPNNDELFSPFDRASLSQSVIDDFTHMTESEKTTDLLVVDAVVSGDLYELSAGTIGFAAGIQARSESFKVDTDDVFEIKFDEQGNPIPVDLIFLQGLSKVDVDRSSFAMFAESVIPVSENVEVKTAVRYEKLESDSSFDPKIAVRWQVSDEFILRASASTAFREASLSQKNASSAVITSITDYNDDGSAKSSAFVGVIATGNDNLKPEESENYNVGLIFKPTDNLDFKLDFWSVDYTNMITVENAQGKLIDDPNGADIIRTDAGFLQSVKVNYFNSSSVSVNGFDIESTWTISDQFNLILNASHFNSYELTKDNGEVVEAAGSFNIDNFARSMPETKGSLNLNWIGDSQRASLNVNYVSSYDTGVDVSALPNESTTVDAFTTIDAQYSATLNVTQDGEAVVTLGIKNLLDELPPRAYTAVGSLSYDPKQHNPLGRVLYAKVKYVF